ncbi:MAG: hypothetical protein EB059_06695 [Alphaproteobacteria bacterium]|nr:hypothetical protein [Alphaproteobacteria bacterium]
MLKKQKINKVNSWMPAFAGMTAIFVLMLMTSAQAQETKSYNFKTRPSMPVEETVQEETKETPPPAPAATVEPEPNSSKIVNGVYSPKGKHVAAQRVSNAKKAEELVRFFIGACLKYYGRNDEMIAYMDAAFPRLDTERKAAFAPVIAGNINTQYWDVTLNDNTYYMLAKDTSGGKCDVIAKDSPSTDVHKELKAVMDGLTLTNILITKTHYEKIAKQNKEVTIVNILGHPLVKELAMVATTQIKNAGDNVGAILTLFTVPEETVEVKVLSP